MIGPIASLRRSLYRWEILRSERLPRPVISVGNLTVGGSGKTPHVQFFASWMARIGLKPAVLSRGYGRESRGVVWVSRGDGPLVSPEIGGDEPVLLAALLPGIPVLAGENRAEAGRECLRHCDVEVFLLDDGFQHLSLRRDADVLLVDAAGEPGDRRTLPFGRLRESAGAARYADALVVTRCADLAAGEIVAADVPIPAGRPRAFSRLVPRSLVDRRGIESALPPPGSEVAAFCGLARNRQFAETLRESGIVLRQFLEYRDHHPYRAADITRIAQAAGALPVLTTEKDLVRLPECLPFEVKGVRVGVEFLAGWEALSRYLVERVCRAERR